jgi:Protein interacting with poly(A)-binding protein
MSEPNAESQPVPPVPEAPTFTYGSPAQAVPPAPQPSADPLPPPAYGERIPGYVPPPAAPQYGQPVAQPGYAQPAYGQSAYGQPYAPAPGGRRRRTWDVVFTIILLAVGLIGMIIGLFYAAIFADPVLVKQVFDEAFRQYGLGGWNGTVGAAPTVIAVSHVVLYLVALGVGILLLVTKRIAFWVPLTAGVVAAVIFWGALYSVVLSDPAIFTLGG